MENNTSNKGLWIAGGAVITIILFFLLCFRVVGVGQVGIVTRLGHIAREVQSGVVIKAPWPIEHVVKMDIRTQKEQQEANAATHDLQSVSTTLALNYHLTPDTARRVYQTIGTEYKIRVIDPILQEVVKSVTAQYDASELISQRSEVEAKLSTRLGEKLTNRGITVDNVSIVNFQFSAAFDQAIELKQVAQQNAQKAQFELQTAQLKAKAQDVQARTLTSEYLQLQAIEKWNGKMPTYLGGGSVFNIPLTR